MYKKRIKIIQYFFTKKLTRGELVGIIDSFPSPLYKPVRNRRAELLNQIAKVGYNLAKESYFYGPKIRMTIAKTDFPITYSITDPGVHDVKVLETLSEEANLPDTLGGEEYISHKIHEKFALKGIIISAPSCKGMDESEKLSRSLPGKQKKTVEAVFSSLEKLGCQNFNSRSVKGLESRFESVLLAYSVLLSQAQQRFERTLRYSLRY